MKVIGIASSPRCGRVPKDRFNRIMNTKDIMSSIYEIGYEGEVSNSESLLLSAMWGAYKEGADVEIIYPGDPIPKFDGVVLSSPVYFGDRSSILHDFITTTNLKNKAVGVVSSGAKRNGGQETTNIYALYDCLDRGAVITGNGPPTAQYGGTGWAGNKTAIVNDDFGIKTSYGTGSQVAKLTNLAKAPFYDREPKILFVKVTDDLVDLRFVKDFSKAEIDIIDIDKKKIKRCVGCPVCPNGDLTKEYKCILQDDMNEIRKRMIWADCLIFVVGDINRNFQLFIERTRFIRRTHFELGERVYSCINVASSVTNIMSLRIMTNMLRQNMFGLPFYRKYNGVENISSLDYAYLMRMFTRRSITMRERSGIDSQYTAVGYEDAKLDEKAYRD